MKIAIDIDGVLTDLELFMETEGEKFVGHPVVDHNGYDIDTKFNASKETKEAFWDAKFRDYIINAPFKDKVSEITNKLHEDGNEIFIITSRKWHPEYGFKTKEDMTAANLKSLRQANIYFDHYVEAPFPKVKETKDLKIDIFLEDNPTNVIELEKVTKVLLFDAFYNRHVNGKNIHRIH
ncbi:MAG TPA: hypothetical protein DCY94_01395, partial [Firmicutes bacterium]|nr:hypothetical protein [Bacillota bacterium]